jgi:hypothetical protein
MFWDYIEVVMVKLISETSMGNDSGELRSAFFGCFVFILIFLSAVILFMILKANE